LSGRHAHDASSPLHTPLSQHHRFVRDKSRFLWRPLQADRSRPAPVVVLEV